MSYPEGFPRFFTCVWFPRTDDRRICLDFRVVRLRSCLSRDQSTCGVFGRKCDDETLARNIIGKVVYVGWPMLREVAVVAVVGSEGIFKSRRNCLT